MPMSVQAISMDQLPPTKRTVYELLQKLAARHGISVKNRPGDEFPENDGLDHVGFKTPQDYRITGDLTVMQTSGKYKDNPAFSILRIEPGPNGHTPATTAFMADVSKALAVAGLTPKDLAKNAPEARPWLAMYPQTEVDLPISPIEADATLTQFAKALNLLVMRDPHAASLDEIAPAKREVYELLRQLAAKHGIATENPPGQAFPEDDGADHSGLRTPQDYVVMGDLVVTQYDRDPPVIQIEPGKRNLPQTTAFLADVNEALQRAGLSVEIPEGSTQHAPDYPQIITALPGSLFEQEAARAQFTEALKKAVGKPGPAADQPVATAAGVAQAVERA